MWGIRVIIPAKLRPQVQHLLHEGHLGVVKMKSLVRSHVWWPGIDSDIEQMAKGCLWCQSVQKVPAQAPLHPWEWPSKHWQRVHVDYAGPFQGTMILIIIDAHRNGPR